MFLPINKWDQIPARGPRWALNDIWAPLAGFSLTQSLMEPAWLLWAIPQALLPLGLCTCCAHHLGTPLPYPPRRPRKLLPMGPDIYGQSHPPKPFTRAWTPAPQHLGKKVPASCRWRKGACHGRDEEPGNASPQALQARPELKPLGSPRTSLPAGVCLFPGDSGVGLLGTVRVKVPGL